ncbi:MAG: tRNA (adenosine(37)-N6)-dimethylallyltransferase MiaA [Candidatus Acidiferrales bacterium]
MMALPRLIVVLGPTASGKSALGIWLAQRLGGQILVCDSTQVYRHFNIGTAKIPSAEQQGIAHHLVDLVEPEEVFTAGEYRRRALEVLEQVCHRRAVPILTAGSGLYLRALLEGLAEAPVRTEELRERLRAKAKLHGPQHLHRLLQRLDAESAKRIASCDTQKVIRAIEMRLVTGRPVGDIYRGGREPLAGYEVIKIGLLPARTALYHRIHQRIDAMVRAGWIEEVRQLIEDGVPAGAKPFQFIGYSEWRDYLAGQLSKNEALERIQQATRNFAKRQMTWFRKEKAVHWLEGFGDSPEISSAALLRIQS